MKCIEKFSMDYDIEDIYRARDNNRILTLDLELSRRCNYKCIYCYSSAGGGLENEMSFKEIKDLILEAREIGVQRIIIVGGGEPMIYLHIEELLIFLNRHGIDTILYTNGTKVTAEFAELSFNLNVGIILKRNSLDERIFNELCGNEKANKVFLEALNNLVNAGYTKKNNRLGISSIICSKNLHEIEDMWIWARENNIHTYFETFTPQGRGKKHDLEISISETEEIFKRLAEIDEKRYSVKWKHISPPYAGMTCNRHLYSLYIKSNGEVQSCSGVELVIGDIRKNSLVEIIESSPDLKKLRNSEKLVKGKCRDCENNPECYGCRGAAYQVTGDYLEADPQCWHNDCYGKKCSNI